MTPFNRPAELTMPQRLTNARLILRDRVVDGAVDLEAGLIATMGACEAAVEPYDCDGDFLLPGLVELHTDNLEKHLLPRSGALWPALPALLAHDAQLLAAGITTALDAIALGDLEEEGVRVSTLDDTIAALDRAARRDLLRIDHYLHLRCELCYPDLPQLLAPLIAHPRARLVSFMDHTPGQRQYRDLEQYRRYYARTGTIWDDLQFAQLVEERVEQQQRYRAKHLDEVVVQARDHGLVLASHDDTECAHVAEARALGASIAEFPVTLETAQAARAAGMTIVAGAANLVRGGSHSGNVAAIDLARAHCLDVLSSDYVPTSLLHGAFLLQREAGWNLPRAVATVTRAPAQALGFEDRGEIAPGLRADLVQVRLVDGLPVVRAVWRGGVRRL